MVIFNTAYINYLNTLEHVYLIYFAKVQKNFFLLEFVV